MEKQVRPSRETKQRPNLSVSIADADSEIRAAKRLRYQVFANEMGARLDVREPGIDHDLYDPFCKHLIVRDDNAGIIVGTYRILSPAAARRLGSYYSESEFDLTRLQHLRPSLVEIGRSCVHSDYRTGATITAHLQATGDLRVGADVTDDASTTLHVDPATQTVTTQNVTIKGALSQQGEATFLGAVAVVQDGRISAQVLPGGDVRLGTDITQPEQTAFHYQAEQNNLLLRASTYLVGDVNIDGDITTTDGDHVTARLDRTGLFKLGPDVDQPDGTRLFYDPATQTLTVTAPVRLAGDLQTSGAITVGSDANRLTSFGKDGQVEFGANNPTPDFVYSTSARTVRINVPLAVAADATLDGTLRVGDQGGVVFGHDDSVQINREGLTMRLLPGEQNSIKVLGIGRAALLNAYQSADSTQHFDLLGYYNSGVPSLHGRVQLGVDNASGGETDLYLRLTRYFTGARNVEIRASFVDIESERAQFRGNVNVRGGFEFSGDQGSRTFRLRNLPVNPDGLPQGAVWNDGGTLRIVI